MIFTGYRRLAPDAEPVAKTAMLHGGEHHARQDGKLVELAASCRADEQAA